MAKSPTAPAPRRPRPAAARPAAAGGAVASNVVAAPVAKPRFSPQKFATEVRTEARKITWPTWKETWITSVMVFLMVVFTALFFLVVDGGVMFVVTNLLKLAG